jgi:hypothetical protein
MISMMNFTITCDQGGYLLTQVIGDNELKILFCDVSKNFVVDYINNSSSMFKLVKIYCDKINKKSIKSALAADICFAM